MEGVSPTMAYETLLLEVTDGIATITVNRPAKRNSLNRAVRREFVEVLDALRDDPEVRVVIITGAGERAFIAGADINEFADRSPLEQRTAMEGRRLFEQIAAYPKPTIAMINGYALGGGCEVALACDIRIAGHSAKLGQPEIKLGLIPGGGGTQRLPRLIGYGRAMRYILTGELIEAEEAERIGLVSFVVDDADLRDETLSVARELASSSPVALKLAKDAVRATLEMPIGAGLRHERELFVTAYASDDRVEGVNAFLEKRAPAFAGR